MDKSALFSFTPSLMDEETLEAIFVQREELATDLVERIRESVLTPSKLHTLIVGARGMGKTHLISLVYHRVQAMSDLKDRLLIAWLREEEWGITSFLDLQLRIFRALEEANPAIAERVEGLYNLSQEEADTAGTRLLNEIIGDRNLLLIAENLDDLFGGLGEAGQQQLRAFLQNYSNCTILATSPRLFNGIQRRSAPFYGFFRPVHLDELTLEEAQQLLANIAILRKQTELADFLQTPLGKMRIRAVQHLAGGNPRIYIIFADFLTQQSLEELVSPFISLVDVLTPYYQSRMQYLSPQQRKIVELLCEKKHPLAVKTIAQRCFMTAQTASSQLKELRAKGYVKAEAIGRDSFYEITEPLMRICLGVKKERGEPMRLIVDFLRVWYPQAELKAMQQALLIAPEQFSVMYRYLEEALDNGKITDEDPRIQAYLDEIQDHLAHKNYSGALEIAEMLLRVCDSWVERERYATCLANLGRYEESLLYSNQAIELNPNYQKAWNIQSIALLSLGRNEEALASYNEGLKINPNSWISWVGKSRALNRLSRFEEALASSSKALEINPSHQLLKDLYYDALFILFQSVRLKEILEKVLDEGFPITSDRLELLVQTLFIQIPDLSVWKSNIAKLVELCSDKFALTELGVALVNSTGEFTSEMVSLAKASIWRDAWAEVVGYKPEFELPLRLLNTALHYKQTPEDPRVFLELSTEERKILQQALRLEA
jgi:tetratricopeptide (TPR) repeat protein